MELRFLVDEDCSPTHASRLANEGFFAEHVVHRGLGSAKDHELAAYALQHSLIIITKNCRDFIKLARRSDVHPGMILLREGHLSADQEWAYIQPVVAHLSHAECDPVNKVVDVTAPGVFLILDIPPA